MTTDRVIARAKAKYAMTQDAKAKANAKAELVRYGLGDVVDKAEAGDRNIANEKAKYAIAQDARAKARLVVYGANLRTLKEIAKAKAKLGMAKDPVDKAEAAKLLAGHGLMDDASDEVSYVSTVDASGDQETDNEKITVETVVSEDDVFDEVMANVSAQEKVTMLLDGSQEVVADDSQEATLKTVVVLDDGSKEVVADEDRTCMDAIASLWLNLLSAILVWLIASQVMREDQEL